MEQVSFVRRKGQKTIRIKACKGGVVVTYPYRYPLFLVKRSVLSGNVMQKLLNKQKEKEEEIKTLCLPEEMFKEHTLKERKEFEKKYDEGLKNAISSLAEEMNVSYTSITFKRTRSRFGSCSSKGNLTFHYKIYFMNEMMQKYLIVHELAHLTHMNHSKEFWTLVAQFVPEMEEAKRQLLLLSSYL